MIKLQENISLAKYSFFRTGGIAKYFVEFNESADFSELKNIIKKLGAIKIIILGAGSNVLISDDGWDGLVIKNNYNRLEQKTDGNWLIASGVMLPYAARFLATKGYGGLERLANIPGTIGGAIRGNAEAWHQSISDYLVELTWIDWKGNEKIFNKNESQFTYRSSIFKARKEFQSGMIKEAVFCFPTANSSKLLELIESDKKSRGENQPAEFSCGCFFKNVLLNSENWRNIETKMGKNSLETRKEGDHFSAGKLIDWCGLKGLCVGQACVSQVHANFIVNLDQASSKDIYHLSQKIFLVVKEKIGIELEPEVQIYGKFD